MRRARCLQSDKLPAARATSESSNVQRLDELTQTFVKVQDATGLANTIVLRVSRQNLLFIVCTADATYRLNERAAYRRNVQGRPVHRCANAGMKDMAELADALAAVQDHSFSLFGFVGELNLEVRQYLDAAIIHIEALFRSPLWATSWYI